MLVSPEGTNIIAGDMVFVLEEVWVLDVTTEILHALLFPSLRKKLR